MSEWLGLQTHHSPDPCGPVSHSDHNYTRDRGNPQTRLTPPRLGQDTTNSPDTDSSWRQPQQYGQHTDAKIWLTECRNIGDTFLLRRLLNGEVSIWDLTGNTITDCNERP